MSINASTLVKIQPSTDIPGLLMQFNQPSGAFNALSGRAPEVKLGEEDQQVYIKRLDVRTGALVGRAASNQMPGVGITQSIISTPTYLLRNKVMFDHHETNSASIFGYSADEAYTNGIKQGFNQQMRVGLLYGMSPSNGEGLLNTNGATAESLPADSFGNTTIQTYDNGAMFQQVLKYIREQVARTYQFGNKQRCVVTGPTRIIGLWMTSVVQLAASQRDGGGTDTIVSAVKRVMAESDIEVEFCFDDTLIGKGSGGKDAILMTLPDIEVPKTVSRVDTNVFARTQPSITGCNVMYQDFSEPKQIRGYVGNGFSELLMEIRITSGWGIRPECVTIISATY